MLQFGFRSGWTCQIVPQIPAIMISVFSDMLSWFDSRAPILPPAGSAVDLFQMFQKIQILFRKSPLAGLQVTYQREL